MADLTHLDALRARRIREQAYLAAAKSQREIELRTIWLAQIDREIADELRFLGLDAEPADMTDAELLAALSE